MQYTSSFAIVKAIWFSLDQMVELFQRNKSTISRHIKNVFEEEELRPNATIVFWGKFVH
jgi:hypothetical protein